MAARRSKLTIGEADELATNARRGKTLKDYASALRPPATDPYTHEVLSADGFPFGLYKSEARADYWAGKIGGTVRLFVPNPATTVPIGDSYAH